MTAATLHLELDLVPGSCLLPDLGLSLSFQFDPRGVVAAGLPFSSLCRDTLRGLIRSGQQLVEPRCPVVLLGFIFRALTRLRPGNRQRVHIRDVLRRPGLPCIAGGLVLAGIGAIHSLRFCLEPLPPSSCQLRLVLQLRI